MKECPACRKQVQDDAQDCAWCGVFFNKWAARSSASTAPAALENDIPAPPMAPAAFWVRAGALVIDCYLMLPIFLLLRKALEMLSLPEKAFAFLAAPLGAFYFIWTVARWGQTLGKEIAHIKIVRTDGSAVGYVGATVRHIATYFSGMFFFAGYLLAVVTSRKQTLHDMVAGTQVVDLPDQTSGRRQAMALVVVAGILAPIVFGFQSAFSSLSGRDGMRRGSSSERLAVVQNLGKLGQLRNMNTEFLMDNMRYPKDLADIRASKHFAGIPSLRLKTHGHKESADITVYTEDVCGGDRDIDFKKVRDTGGWGYVANPKLRCNGMFFIDCTDPAYVARQ